MAAYYCVASVLLLLMSTIVKARNLQVRTSLRSACIHGQNQEHSVRGSMPTYDHQPLELCKCSGVVQYMVVTRHWSVQVKTSVIFRFSAGMFVMCRWSVQT